jgi:hypothetical protein
VKMREEEKGSVGLEALETFFTRRAAYTGFRFTSCWKTILIRGGDCSLTCGWGVLITGRNTIVPKIN